MALPDALAALKEVLGDGAEPAAAGGAGAAPHRAPAPSAAAAAAPPATATPLSLQVRGLRKPQADASVQRNVSEVRRRVLSLGLAAQA